MCKNVCFVNNIYPFQNSRIYPFQRSIPKRFRTPQCIRIKQIHLLTPSKYIMARSSSRSTRLIVGSSFSCGDREGRERERIKHWLHYLRSKEDQSPSSVTHSLQRRLIQLKSRQQPDVNDHHVGLLSCAVIPVIQSNSHKQGSQPHIVCSLTDSKKSVRP